MTTPVSRRRFLVSAVGWTAVAALPRRAWAAATEALPKTRAVLLRGMERGLHIGAQIYVSRDGKTLRGFRRGRG